MYIQTEFRFPSNIRPSQLESTILVIVYWLNVNIFAVGAN